jgi:hypothetical protein
MSWVIPRLLNLVLLQKQGKCAETYSQKAESGTPLVEEDPGWSLLELISRRPGRRESEGWLTSVKPRDH